MFQVSRNYRWNSCLFVCYHAWSDFLPAFFIKLKLWRFLPVRQLLPFLFICTMSNAFFLQRQCPEVLRSLENVCLNRISKRDWAWGVLFLPFGKGEGDANISYYYSMNTLGLCFEQGGTKTLERQFSGNMGNSNFKISPCMGWRLMDTNLRKLPSRIKFFKTWQVWVYLIQNWTKSITNIIFIFSDCFLQTT